MFNAVDSFSDLEDILFRYCGLQTIDTTICNNYFNRITRSSRYCYNYRLRPSRRKMKTSVCNTFFMSGEIKELKKGGAKKTQGLNI